MDIGCFRLVFLFFGCGVGGQYSERDVPTLWVLLPVPGYFGPIMYMKFREGVFLGHACSM